VHGNVCLASVVVTATLDWKLHGLDVLSEFDGANPAASGPMLVSSSHLFSSLNNDFIVHVFSKSTKWYGMLNRL
jgi:hypothetical protein